jgi:putative ubiquitin-RnfH superfamily antitoxin RatB of RatAB toxin-antitoxin module
MAPADTLRVQVVFCTQPGRTEVCELMLPQGAVLSQALAASGLVERHALRLDELKAGIWGKVRELTTVLRDHDRVEIYRPLQVDPKEARRLRYKRDRGRRALESKPGTPAAD